MKRCPTCNQTFEEEWLSFCPQDGTTLVEAEGGSREPPPTIMAEPKSASPENQRTLNLPGGYTAPPMDAQSRPIASSWQPPPPPSYAEPQNNGLAIASMVVGIGSLICLGPVLGAVAIILGAVALSQIKKNPDKVGGKPFAVTGVVTGSISVVICGGIGIFYIVMMAIAAAANH